VRCPAVIHRRTCVPSSEGGAGGAAPLIQRMQPIISLEFSDYVNQTTVLAWEANEARERAASQKAPVAPALVAVK
jgi:hypothetical protein